MKKTMLVQTLPYFADDGDVDCNGGARAVVWLAVCHSVADHGRYCDNDFCGYIYDMSVTADAVLVCHAIRCFPQCQLDHGRRCQRCTQHETSAMHGLFHLIDVYSRELDCLSETCVTLGLAPVPVHGSRHNSFAVHCCVSSTCSLRQFLSLSKEVNQVPAVWCL